MKIKEPLTQWLGVGSITLLVVVLSGSVGMTLDEPEAWSKYGMIILGLAIVCVLMLLCHLCTYVVIDEAGIMRKLFFRGKIQLTWPKVRTAVVVQIPNSGGPGIPFILLSNQDKEQTLQRNHLSWGMMQQDKEVRIPYTEKRRKAIEYYLGYPLEEWIA